MVLGFFSMQGNNCDALLSTRNVFVCDENEKKSNSENCCFARMDEALQTLKKEMVSKISNSL